MAAQLGRGNPGRFGSELFSAPLPRCLLRRRSRARSAARARVRRGVRGARLVRVHANGSGRQVLYDGTDAATARPGARSRRREHPLRHPSRRRGNHLAASCRSGGGPATTFAAPPVSSSLAGPPTETSSPGTAAAARARSASRRPAAPPSARVTPRRLGGEQPHELGAERHRARHRATAARRRHRSLHPDGRGRHVPLSVGEHIDYGPGWSPDGSLVAFLRNDLSDANSGIYTVKPDGTDLQQVVVGRFYSEVYWSPDGTPARHLAVRRAQSRLPARHRRCRDQGGDAGVHARARDGSTTRTPGHRAESSCSRRTRTRTGDMR